MTAPQPDEGLFAVVRSPGTPDYPGRVSFTVLDEPDDLRRGPGPQPKPTMARPPDWWRQEARVIFLEEAAKPDGTTIEAVRDRLPEPVDASNASLGALVQGLAREGLIRCVGFEASTRPSSHGRYLRRWVVAR